MSNIQHTLDSLQPYVIGIRFLKTQPVVDVVLNEGWTLPEDSNITRTKGDESMNYHMIHSDVDGIGLDKLLEYIDKTIKLNLEREKKHELLKVKVNLLKEVFKKNSLEKLQRLKFTFGEEDFLTNMSDIDIDIDEEPVKPSPTKESTNEATQVEFIEETVQEPITTEIPTYLDEDGKPIEMSEEEKELAQEEARAERNRKILENRKQKQSVPKPSKKVELPPKKMSVMTSQMEYGSDCDCGPGQACGKCIDNQDY